MQYLDLQVIERTRKWVAQGQTTWLCTVLTTFGSSPRVPGALLVAREDGQHLGSLSGGCVEEDFLERLRSGEFNQRVQRVCYGGGMNRVQLPCGGSLEVLVERLPANKATMSQLNKMHDALSGGRPIIRRVALDGGGVNIEFSTEPGPAVTLDESVANVRIGPALRLIVAGISSVSEACASFASTLGFEVIVCDPCDDTCRNFNVPGVNVRAMLPSVFIASEGCHSATAIVALTHDPRIDDLAMMEAVRTDAFYIGVMGSSRTSQRRKERLLRSGGLSSEEIQRIVMPIGLGLGSKTPAEIALAVMADIIRVHRGKTLCEL